MKKIVLIAAVMAVVLVLGIVAGITVFHREAAFDGSRVANPDAFLLKFTEMNKSDSHTVRLKSGDTLRVSYAIDKGRIDVEIGMDGQPPIYRGNGIRTGAFELPVKEAGGYTIRVEARHAAGTLAFETGEK